MALNGMFCADVPLRTYSLFRKPPIWFVMHGRHLTLHHYSPVGSPLLLLIWI